MHRLQEWYSSPELHVTIGYFFPCFNIGLSLSLFLSLSLSLTLFLSFCLSWDREPNANRGCWKLTVSNIMSAGGGSSLSSQNKCRLWPAGGAPATSSDSCLSRPGNNNYCHYCYAHAYITTTTTTAVAATATTAAFYNLTMQNIHTT